METDSRGFPMIVGTIDGLHYRVFFYGCTKGATGCDSIQLMATWPAGTMSLEQVNEWNRTKRFGKAYLRTDGSVALEMQINLDGGVARSNLTDTFDWWRIGMSEFADSMRGR